MGLYRKSRSTISRIVKLIRLETSDGQAEAQGGDARGPLLGREGQWPARCRQQHADGHGGPAARPRLPRAPHPAAVRRWIMRDAPLAAGSS